MNIRDTSVEAYKQVIESGFLSSQLIKAFDIVFRFGPLTSRDANQRFVSLYRGENNLNQFRALLTHLQNMGVVATVDKVKCPETDKTVYQFDVTGRVPVKVKKLSMADKKRDILKTIDVLEPWVGNLGGMALEDLKYLINNL